MILQALARYYSRLAEEGKVAPQGFKRVEIPFIIVLDQDGRFIDLQDTRSLNGKRLVARAFLVPEERERAGTRAWQTSNLLWDHYGYVVAWPKSQLEVDRETARKQHQSFLVEVERLRECCPNDIGIAAVHQFLSSGNFAALFEHPLWKECAKIPGCNLTFMIHGQTRLVCDSENVKDFIANEWVVDAKERDGLHKTESFCLITGEYGPVERKHRRTPIARAKSNAKIVSFQRNMGFDSYSKSQSYNAPTGRMAAFAYCTALNKMLARDSIQNFIIGADTIVFWAERSHEIENIFASLFGEVSGAESVQDYKSILGMFRAPLTAAALPRLNPTTQFHVLGLAPNVARIAVRFWYVGSVREIADNIWSHFDDLEMVKSAKEWRSVALPKLLRSVAVLGKDENLTPNLAGDTMKAILTGMPYPHTLLAAAVRRCRAEQARKDPITGKLIQNVSYLRASLIKAVLTRDHRLGSRFCTNEKEVSMSLDLEIRNTGYRLGRLFALLEKIQEEANPRINATIRDRFYGSASATPVIAFPHLMKLKNHHLAKLENRGRAINFERMIGEIMDGLVDFPAHLSLPDQGRFAVGYYHQRQAFFSGSKEAKS